MRYGFKPRQTKESAGSLYRVHEPENIIENLRVIRIAFELDQLHVDEIKTLRSLGQKIAKKIIHAGTSS